MLHYIAAGEGRRFQNRTHGDPEHQWVFLDIPMCPRRLTHRCASVLNTHTLTHTLIHMQRLTFIRAYTSSNSHLKTFVHVLGGILIQACSNSINAVYMDWKTVINVTAESNI